MTEVAMSATVGMSATMAEMSATMAEMSATVGECLQQWGNVRNSGGMSATVGKLNMV